MFNKSAKTIRKILGHSNFCFCNTTGEITRKSNGKPKPDFEHFEKVIKRLRGFDFILVCGKQAEFVVRKNLDKIENLGIPFMFIPHPASRSLSNKEIDKLKSEIVCSHSRI